MTKYKTFKELKIPTELEKDGVTKCVNINCWGEEHDCSTCILATFSIPTRAPILNEYLETRRGEMTDKLFSESKSVNQHRSVSVTELPDGSFAIQGNTLFYMKAWR